MLWSLKPSLWSVLVSGISLQGELALWDESQTTLSMSWSLLSCTPRQNFSEELQVTCGWDFMPEITPYLRV